MKKKKKKNVFHLSTVQVIGDFMSFLTVFQSYQDDGTLIMNGCVQWKLVYFWKDFNHNATEIMKMLGTIFRQHCHYLTGFYAH